MYVIPQSEFILYTGIPFDREHKHIRMFTSLGEQQSYFAGKIKKTYSNFSYVREQRGIRINDVADFALECNYCSFLNKGFGSKRFYAFITGVEYLANKTTQITIQIDYVQTFILDWKIGKCFVEREHVLDDGIGRNTVSENLETGEYIVSSDGGYNAGIGIIGYFLEEDGSINNGVYSATSVFTSTDAPSMNSWVNRYEETPEKVIMISMCSADMVSGLNPQSKSFSINFSGRNHTFSFNGESYVAKNNKLLSWPYRFLTIDNYNGNTEQLLWENFNEQSSPQQVSFQINESPTPKPCMEIFPLDYNGVHSAQSQGVAYDNFPQCAYNVDTFKAWISQAVPQALVNTGASMAIGVAAGGSVGAAIGLVGGATNFALEYKQKKLHSQSLGGTISAAGMNFSQGRIGFRIQEHTIKPEYARIIDEFFTRFGYKVDRYKIPNTTGRPDFNYVKCVESVCDGNVPEECITEVEGMFNSGVTIHHIDF